MGMHKILTIFDADWLLFTATMGNKCLDDEGNPIKIDNKFTYIDKTKEEIYKCADEIIKIILNISMADYYTGFLGGCKSFRYGVYPEYKGNRINNILPNFHNELKQYLVDEWGFVRTSNGLEADDAVNIVRNNLKNELDCIIVSSDKDLIKSIEGIYIDARHLSSVVTSSNEAYEFFWKSMICGDVADNIKGIPSKGIVYANKLIDFAKEKGTSISTEVLDRYIRYFGENEGIEEFFKNYKCLHILDNFSNFVIPELKVWNKEFTQNFEELNIEGI